MSLVQVLAGEKVVVVAINTDQELLGRLMGMGLFIGTKVEILQGGKGKSGPLRIGIGQTRIVLGRDIAAAIMVANERIEDRG